jgi:hypothetical protein
MAALLGVTTGSADAGANSIATGALTTLPRTTRWIGTKWEWTGVGTRPDVLSVTDTAGNVYELEQESDPITASFPGGAVWVCRNALAHAANVVTVTFVVGSTAQFRRVWQLEWDGLARKAQNNFGSGSSAVYSTGDLDPEGPGLMIALLAGFATLTNITAGGNPPAQLLSQTLGEAFVVYRIATAAGLITPGASSSISSEWKMIATTFTDMPFAFTHDITRAALLAQPGIPNSAMRDARSWF